MKLPNLNPQRWFVSSTPQLATSAAGDERFGTMQFSSRNNGGDSGDGGDYGFPDDDETQVSETPPESTRSGRFGGGSGSGGGGNRGGGSGGRQRTIQFQPEDRYWTEYLRIALPIIGLILMLGLFWYWATNIIGDDPEEDDPVATETLGAVETIAAEPTETAGATEASTVANTPEPTEESAEPTETAEETPEGDNTTDSEEETPEDEPTEEPDDDSGSGEFAADDVVVINADGEGGVNMRSDPTTAEENIVTTLQPGDELTVADGPEEAEDYVWYQVVTEDGETGWVVDDYLEAAP